MESLGFSRTAVENIYKNNEERIRKEGRHNHNLAAIPRMALSKTIRAISSGFDKHGNIESFKDEINSRFGSRGTRGA